jgi:hypothetical protein
MQSTHRLNIFDFPALARFAERAGLLEHEF